MARGMSYKIRGNLGKERPRAGAARGWTGTTGSGRRKMVPYSSFHHRRWYWCSNFGSGDIANQTVHDMDIIRWGLGLDTHPTKVQSMGGRYVPAADDDADTPNTQTFACQWQGRDLLVQFEIRHWYTQHRGGHGRQVSVRGSRQRGGRDLLRHQGLHDLPGLQQLPRLPRPEARAGALCPRGGRADDGPGALPELDRRGAQPQARAI